MMGLLLHYNSTFEMFWLNIHTLQPFMMSKEIYIFASTYDLELII